MREKRQLDKPKKKKKKTLRHSTWEFSIYSSSNNIPVFVLDISE